MGYYRIGTINYFENHFPGCYAFSSCCTAPNCTYFGTVDGSQVNTSDLMAGLWVQIAAAADGEAFTFEAVAPNGTIWGNGTITYTASTGCWAWSNGNAADWSFEGTPGLGGGGGNVMCPGAYAAIWAGPSLPCFSNAAPLSGNWKHEMFDSANPGSPVIIHTFNLLHNSSSQLSITSPIPSNLQDNALIDLAADQNYAATDATCPPPSNGASNPTAACYTASATGGNQINWTTQLSYATSGSHGSILDPSAGPLTFVTSSGQSQNHVYSNEGGQISITASTTAADGSIVKDCTTAYLEGPASAAGAFPMRLSQRSSKPRRNHTPTVRVIHRAGHRR